MAPGRAGLRDRGREPKQSIPPPRQGARAARRAGGLADELEPNPDDRDAGHATGTYMSLVSTWNGAPRYRSIQHRQKGCPAGSA